jgi:DNA-directed RNA polymerase specialized sigma24 family protein
METNELYKKLRYLITKNIYFSQIKNKEDRETIINNSFINIWTRINNGELSNEWDEIKGYCFISLKNNTLEYIRSSKKRINNLEYIDEINSDIEIYEEDNDSVEIDKIKSLIENPMVLNKIQSKIMLEKLNGLTHKQIGELYGLTTDQVTKYSKTSINRIRFELGMENGCKTKIKKSYIYEITNTITNETNAYLNKSIMAKDYGLTRRELKKLIDNKIYGNYTLIIEDK